MGASAAWRANTAAAATLGAVLGALPGALLLTRIPEPLATLAAGPAVLLTSGVFAALLAAWTANLALESGRTRILPLVATALVVASLVATMWLALVATGAWSATFPFPPYFGLLGLSLFLGAAVGFAALALREAFDWDGLDVATSLCWAALPPGLLVGLVRVACAQGACA